MTREQADLLTSRTRLAESVNRFLILRLERYEQHIVDQSTYIKKLKNHIKKISKETNDRPTKS